MKPNFYLRDKNSKKPTAIILFASHSNGRLKYYTGEYTTPTNWNFDKQFCKKNASINKTLDGIKEAVQRAESKLIEKGTRVTNEVLKEQLLIELKRNHEPEVKPSLKDPQTLYELLERFISAREGLRAKGTMQRYTALRSHLIGYEDKHGQVLLKDLNIEFGDSFASYLYKQGHQSNTVGKIAIGLKVLLNWAVGSGMSIPPHYKKFAIPSAPSKIIALTEEELTRFATVKIPKTEEVTRDLYLFSVYTGLRYSDVIRVTPEMVEGKFLSVTPQKTARKKDAKELRVYLVPEAIEILNKYKNTLKGLRTNQGANKGVKRIAELANIDSPTKIVTYFGNRMVDTTVKKWEVLSFHSAKKTHVTLNLKNGVRPEVMSEQLGNTLRTLKPYISIADKDKESEIGKAFKAIKKKGSKLRVA